MQYLINNFIDNNSGMFFYNQEDPDLIVRKMEIVDNVIPSSNASIAKSLFELSILLDNKVYSGLYKAMIMNMKSKTFERPLFSYAWADLMYRTVSKKHELVISGKKAIEYNAMINKYYIQILSKYLQLFGLRQLFDNIYQHHQYSFLKYLQ